MFYPSRQSISKIAKVLTLSKLDRELVFIGSFRHYTYSKSNSQIYHQFMNSHKCVVSFCGFSATGAHEIAVHASKRHNLQIRNPFQLAGALHEKIRAPSSAFIHSSSLGWSANKRFCYGLSTFIAPRAREDCGSTLELTEESAGLIPFTAGKSYNPSIKDGEVQESSFIRESASPSLEIQMHNDGHLSLPTQSKLIKLEQLRSG